jgi:hypothetical protein
VIRAQQVSCPAGQKRFAAVTFVRGRLGTKPARGSLCDAAHRLFAGVHHFRNVVRVHVTRTVYNCNFFDARNEGAATPAPVLTKATNAYRHMRRSHVWSFIQFGQETWKIPTEIFFARGGFLYSIQTGPGDHPAEGRRGLFRLG